MSEYMSATLTEIGVCYIHHFFQSYIDSAFNDRFQFRRDRAYDFIFSLKVLQLPIKFLSVS